MERLTAPTDFGRVSDACTSLFSCDRSRELFVHLTGPLMGSSTLGAWLGRAGRRSR